MIGVILWSDQQTSHAIIWCEDHSGLAYLTGAAAANMKDPLHAGEIVQLEIAMKGLQRLATHVVRLDEKRWGASLPAALKQSVLTQELSAQDGSNIVPLHDDSTPRPLTRAG